jgi:hypothetical protein
VTTERTPAEILIAALNEALNRAAMATSTVTVTHTVTASMSFDRDKLWSAHPEVRLSADELATALGCSARTVYRLVERGLPCRKRDEVYVFLAGHVRDWLADREEIVNRYLPRRAKGQCRT